MEGWRAGKRLVMKASACIPDGRGVVMVDGVV